MNKVYKKVFSRDFCIPWLQIWYKNEAGKTRPWNDKTNPSFPYLVLIRKNDTVESYYDMSGLDWSRNSLIQKVKNDNSFVDKIIFEVNKSIQPINKTINSSEPLDKEKLLEFIGYFSSVYYWFLAMWELCESDEEETESIDISAIGKIKSQNISLTDDIDSLIRRSLSNIFPKIKNYSHMLTIEEIKSDNIPDISILKERDTGFVFTDNKLFESDKLDEIENFYNIKLEENINFIKNISLIKGRPACSGIVMGKVRLVMGYKNISSFQQGEVLVSPMTMPDFAPAMEKACAFITDEGGITCHAAILAREFGKPCITGTIIATQILNNGDLVEVNANTGEIKILERSL